MYNYEEMLKELKKQINESRYNHVLRGSESASMLIELGFISNESDSAFLASDQGQEKVVIAIADSIRENFEE